MGRHVVARGVSPWTQPKLAAKPRRGDTGGACPLAGAFAPPGLRNPLRPQPVAAATGYYVSPLRGWAHTHTPKFSRIQRQESFTALPKQGAFPKPQRGGIRQPRALQPWVTRLLPVGQAPSGRDSSTQRCSTCWEPRLTGAGSNARAPASAKRRVRNCQGILDSSNRGRATARRPKAQSSDGFLECDGLPPAS